MKSVTLNEDIADKLRTLGAYDKFITNIKEDLRQHVSNDGLNSRIESINEANTLYGQVLLAFVWSTTPEGYEYWRKIATHGINSVYLSVWKK